MKLDIFIKNGRVIDPSQGVDNVMNIGVSGNKIINISGIDSIEAERTIDASGHCVFPGLIDYHTHVFYGGGPICVEPNSSFFPNGVTATVDAGSAGWANYRSFHSSVIANSAVRIKSYLHVVNVGLSTLGGGETGYLENINPANFNHEKIQQIFSEYSSSLLGLKLRFGAELYQDKNFGAEPLYKTLELAEKIGCPVCIHATNLAVTADELANSLRKNDVYAHCFHGKNNGIIGSNGRVLDSVLKARDRGVIFDCSNGVAHFDFSVAQSAIDEGFLPDIISTDLTTKNCYAPGMVFGLPFIMSKYLAMGLNIKDILMAVTHTPAKLMGMENEIGTLKPGAFADISIFKLVEKDTVFTDTAGNSRKGNKIFKNQATISNGVVVFRQIDF